MERRNLVYLILAGFFITNALLAEILGGKLIELPLHLPFVDGFPIASLGVILWPVVFITTDLVNEYFGKSGVKQLTFITVGLILFSFLMIFIGMQIPAAQFSPIQDDVFNAVFGQSLWIIVGSIVAFLVSQFVDVSVFWLLRHKTGGAMLWLRATGSTVASQLIDTFIVMGIAFWLPGKINTETYFKLSLTNYSYKFLIAIFLTPFIYIAHSAIDKYLGKKESDSLTDKAAAESI